MVTVDEAGQHDMLRRTNRLVRRVFCRQRRELADFDDHAVALKNGAVFDDVRFIASRHFADDVLAADQRRSHGIGPDRWNGNAGDSGVCALIDGDFRFPDDARPQRHLRFDQRLEFAGRAAHCFNALLGELRFDVVHLHDRCEARHSAP